MQVHRFVSLRGDFTYSRSEYRLNGVETGQDVNRFFYDAAVQLQYPTDLGLEPYTPLTSSRLEPVPFMRGAMCPAVAEALASSTVERLIREVS